MLIIKTNLLDDNGTNTPLLTPDGLSAFMHIMLKTESADSIEINFSNELLIDSETVTFCINPHTVRAEFTALANNITFSNKVNALIASINSEDDFAEAWDSLYTFCECFELEDY